jgi:hypothetical protein
MNWARAQTSSGFSCYTGKNKSPSFFRNMASIVCTKQNHELNEGYPHTVSILSTEGRSTKVDGKRMRAREKLSFFFLLLDGFHSGCVQQHLNIDLFF